MPHSAEYRFHPNTAHIGLYEVIQRNEPTILRETKPGNEREVAMLFRAERSPYMLEVVGGPDDMNQNLQEQKEWMQNMKKRRTVKLLTITDAQTNDDLPIGWIRIDQGTSDTENTQGGSEERRRFIRLMQKKKPGFELPENTPDPCEIAYAPVPGNEHHMGSALRNACHLIETRDKEAGKWSDTDPSLRRPVVVFEGDAEIAQFSVGALLEAGFECRSGKNLINYDKGQKLDTRMYVLNWDKFHAIQNAQETQKKPGNHTPLDVEKMSRLNSVRATLLNSSKRNPS